MSLNRLRIFLLIVATFFLLVGTSLAEPQAGQENLFLLGTDARALGMGGAYVSVTTGASSVYWNPAGLALLDKGEASFLHVSLWEETNYDFLGLAYPTLNFGSLGVGVMRLGTSNIPKRDLNNLDLGTFDNTISLYTFSLASSFPLYTKGGANFKIYNQSIDGNSATGVGLDFGILATPTDHFSWGVNFQDLLEPNLQLENAKENIPFNAKAGISYRGHADLLSFLMAADIDKTEDRRAEFHFGGELGLQDLIFIRGGYDRGYATFGAGLKWNWLRTDYALKTQPELGVTHRISVAIQFGSSLDSRKMAGEEKNRRQAETAQRRKNQERITAYLVEAKQEEEKGEWLAALEKYNQVLALDPGQQFALGKAESLKKQVEAGSEQKASGMAKSSLIESTLSRAKDLYQKGSYKLADTHVQEVLSLDAGNSEALKLRDDIGDARRNRIIQLEQEAQSYQQTGNLDKAILVWTQVLDLDSTSQSAQDGLKQAGLLVKLNTLVKSGIQYFNSGNYSAAQQELLSALSISPRDPVASDYLQKVRAKMEKTTSLEDLKKDSQIWQLYQSGLEKYQNGDYRAAINIWQEVLKAYPNNRNTLRNIEQAKLRLK